MRVAFLDAFSGISGDMLLGALVDAGLSLDSLRAELTSLPVHGYTLVARQVQRASIAATHVTVELADIPQPHRRLADIIAIIDGAALPLIDRDAARRIFWRLAEAEGTVHGSGPDEVHFHEVGAVDAIIDIVGAVVGLRLLGIERLYCSALAVGSGTARAAHGSIPVPAPATAHLLSAVRAPLRDGADEPRMELVTPTGAAIVAELATFGRPAMSLIGVGTGAGTRDLPNRPNVLRLLVGESTEPAATRSVSLLETNIDDMPGELFGHVLELALAAGAADVWFTPIQMKKNRPAVMLSVLCLPERERALADLLLRETSTLGVRVRDLRRYEAERELLTFQSSLGPATVKVKRIPGQAAVAAPEYEVCHRLAISHSLPLHEVYRIVAAEAAAHLPTEPQVGEA